MATRGIYIFKDKHATYRVYKHWDNYPSMAFTFICNAIMYAWELRRFEADEFACAFIAANKKKEGDLRLLRDDTKDVGQQYEYYIYIVDEMLIVEFQDGQKRFKGTLAQMSECVEIQINEDK